MTQTRLSRRLIPFMVVLSMLLILLLVKITFYQGSFAQQAHSATSSTAPCPLIAGGTSCYTPQQIRNTYDIQPLLDRGITGKGQTIVIIGDGASPHLADDLSLYNRLYGLPAATLNVFAPFGNPSSAAEINGIDFDVETAHSIAPGATLDLVLVDTGAAQTFNDHFTLLLKAISYAIDQDLGDVISVSTGFGEGCLDPSAIQLEHREFQKARARHITIFADAGNDGNVVVSCQGSQVIPVKGVSLPASDPLVTAVGGTSLDATSTGAYVNEGAWGQTSFDNHGVPTENATGGGFSSIFARPDYQQTLSGNGEFRGVPDVALDEDPRTGMPYVANQQVATDGSGAPQWAGIAALANQFAGRRLGFLNSSLYRIGASPELYRRAFHDITTGNNTMTISGNGQTIVYPGYDAGPGWDAVSGLGTPDVAQLLPLLAKNCLPADGSTF